MKETPILFSSDMVKAILDGIKTMTRRVIKFNPPVNEFGRGWATPFLAQPYWVFTAGFGMSATQLRVKCPYGQVGDRLWVRETLYIDGTGFCRYGRDVTGLSVRATHPAGFNKSGEKDRIIPSIHMPRWASRITLEITEVRAEKLCDITVASCIAEGLKDTAMIKYDFKDLWDSLNAKRGYGWGTNPWVWCISFKRLEI